MISTKVQIGTERHHGRRLQLYLYAQAAKAEWGDVGAAAREHGVSEPERLRSNFINGIKRMPVRYTHTPRASLSPLRA